MTAPPLSGAPAIRPRSCLARESASRSSAPPILPPPPCGPFPASFGTKHGIGPLVQGHRIPAFPAQPVTPLKISQNGHGPRLSGLEVAIPWPLKADADLTGFGIIPPESKGVRSGHHRLHSISGGRETGQAIGKYGLCEFTRSRPTAREEIARTLKGGEISDRPRVPHPYPHTPIKGGGGGYGSGFLRGGGKVGGSGGRWGDGHDCNAGLLSPSITNSASFPLSP